MSGAATLLMIGQGWLWVGAAVAVAFLTWGIDRIDDDARGAYVFRPLLVPAILLIWPLVLWRWWVLEQGRDNAQARHNPPRIAHRAAALLMGVAIVGVVWAGFAAKQTWPEDIAPVQLSQPGDQG